MCTVLKKENKVYVCPLRTRNACVADFHVGLEFLQAGSRTLKLRVRDAYLTRAPPGAAPVHPEQNVRVAVNVAEVVLDTATDAHASVAGGLHEDHLL